MSSTKQPFGLILSATGTKHKYDSLAVDLFIVTKNSGAELLWKNASDNPGRRAASDVMDDTAGHIRVSPLEHLSAPFGGDKTNPHVMHVHFHKL